MRRFLYLSPYFPPQSRVGALRPFKFARHLPALGWAPIVLSDRYGPPPHKQGLLEALPPSVEVHQDWSSPRGRGLRDWLGAKWPSGDVLPLGMHRLDMRHALKASTELLRRAPDCEAIMVNADPFAAMLVGAELRRRTGLPLIQDLRDPWTPCELRRPRRDRARQAWIRRLEAKALGAASAVILNTETARRDYRAEFPEIPSERLHVLRNHGDPSYTTPGTPPEFQRFTVLFLGGLRRFVEGGELVDALEALGPSWDGQIVVTGAIPEATRRAAADKGVQDKLLQLPPVPLSEIAGWMDRADLLLVVGNHTRQRIPAKVYEYANSRRPILAVHDSPELKQLLESLGGATSVGLGDRDGLIAALREARLAGRARSVARADHGLDSASASARLAAILDAVTEEARP